MLGDKNLVYNFFYLKPILIPFQKFIKIQKHVDGDNQSDSDNFIKETVYLVRFSQIFLKMNKLVKGFLKTFVNRFTLEKHTNLHQHILFVTTEISL